MGYACPVCEVPQEDGEHLAHHLAFTAMIHEADHEAWLDANVDDWRTANPSQLAAAVAPHAPETEFETVFEDTTHRHRDGQERPIDQPKPIDDTRKESLDAEARDVLAEARELTREMQERKDDQRDTDDTEE